MFFDGTSFTKQLERSSSLWGVADGASVNDILAGVHAEWDEAAEASTSEQADNQHEDVGVGSCLGGDSSLGLLVACGAHDGDWALSWPGSLSVLLRFSNLHFL